MNYWIFKVAERKTYPDEHGKVSLVFQHDPAGRVYVSGYCPERGANRVFSLDLIMVIDAWN
jgi:hypothetical protein